jgi:hypothetical protein
MNNKLSTGLLVFIAGLLVVNTYLVASGGSSSSASSKAAPVATRAAVNPATPVNNPSATPTPSSEEEVVDNRPSTAIKFENNEKNFGDILQDSEHKHVFTFTNTGKEPLVIENAKGSCGCTVPKYPKEPIAPGKTGEIEVVYKPGKQKNVQTKNVTITANTEPRNTVLTLKANVLEVEG